MKVIEAVFSEPMITASLLSDGRTTVHRVSYTQDPKRSYKYITNDDDARAGDLYLVSPPAGIRAVSVISVSELNSKHCVGDLKSTLMRIARCHGELAYMNPAAIADPIVTAVSTPDEDKRRATAPETATDATPRARAMYLLARAMTELSKPEAW